MILKLFLFKIKLKVISMKLKNVKAKKIFTILHCTKCPIQKKDVLLVTYYFWTLHLCHWVSKLQMESWQQLFHETRLSLRENRKYFLQKKNLINDLTHNQSLFISNRICVVKNK